MKWKLVTALYVSLCFISSTANATWHQKTFEVMGTLAHVEFWLDDAELQLAKPEDQIDKASELIAKVELEMQRIDKTMSPYVETSELSMLNREASKKAVKVSPEMLELIRTSIDISKLSQGAFDITYASVGYQYDYRGKKKPSQEAINRTLNAINYRAIELDAATSTIRFTRPNVKVDLGGIAKGHAVKQCLAILETEGVQHALVSAGGDTGLLGDRRGRPWYVGIKHPRALEKAAVQLPLSDESISTSGDYERYFIEDGVRYHHIINPKTGDSARKVVSVSIVGKDATYVDALSTAVFVKGLADGMQLINQLPDYEAIIIDNQQTLHVSTGLQQQ